MTTRKPGHLQTTLVSSLLMILVYLGGFYACYEPMPSEYAWSYNRCPRGWVPQPCWDVLKVIYQPMLTLTHGPAEIQP